MIDLSPNDPTCILSTLHFVCRQSAQYNKSSVLTFDQPLFQKALDIVNIEEPSSPLKKLVLRLGGFHTQMSYLGCIGYLMAGSGLSEALETVYASNAVSHMMSGKAVQRAIRGHILIENALTILLLEKASCSETDGNKDRIDDTTALFYTLVNNSDLKRLASLYDEMKETKDSSAVMKSDILSSVKETLAAEKDQLSDNRTANLWHQYMEMVMIL